MNVIALFTKICLFCVVLILCKCIISQALMCLFRSAHEVQGQRQSVACNFPVASLISCAFSSLCRTHCKDNLVLLATEEGLRSQGGFCSCWNITSGSRQQVCTECAILFTILEDF